MVSQGSGGPPYRSQRVPAPLTRCRPAHCERSWPATIPQKTAKPTSLSSWHWVISVSMPHCAGSGPPRMLPVPWHQGLPGRTVTVRRPVRSSAGAL